MRVQGRPIMRTIKSFDVRDVARLRERATEAARVPLEGTDGWTKSATDPMKLLSVFEPLRLKEGFVLRAYQYRSGGNGNGIVFAMPDGSPFPAPDECRPEPPEHSEDREPVPFPAKAQLDMMSLIEGDGEPWSYVLASLLARELWEFGALWHGCSWDAHTILGENPLTSSRKSRRDRPDDWPDCDPKHWKWEKRKPRQWQPTVGKDSGRVLVRFFTYSGLGQEAIYRHLDTYEPGSYTFETERTIIARGREGYLF